MAKVRNPRTPPPISADECQRLVQIADKVAAEHIGTFDELESAIGVLFLGRLMGWKPLLIIHNKRTLKKYEEMLGINFREAFPEVGPFAERSRAWGIVQSLSNFWKAVNGDISVPDRRSIAKR
jgi:hypothetical protein